MITRKPVAWRKLLPATCMLILGASAAAQHQPTITSIDAPLAGGISGYGTEVIAANPLGMITGFYVGYDNVVHAYVRSPEGKFTSFDGPGVPSSLPDADDPYTPPKTWINLNAPGTYGAAINLMGAVTGYYIDASNVAHGYLRAPDGRFTSFDVRDAGTQAGQGTFSTNINLEGTIAGYYLDASNGSHGFVRAVDGKITEFDAPDGVGNTSVGWAQCINMWGVVAGTYFDSTGASRGFVREPDGKFKTFAVEATGLMAWSVQGTNIWGINNTGETVGAFVDANGVDHGLVRTADGQITVFDSPLAAGNTVSEDINDLGVVAGFYNDASRVHHGFLRSPEGKFTFFDVSWGGSQLLQGTVPMFDDVNTVVGFYVDSNYVWHGFVRK